MTVEKIAVNEDYFIEPDRLERMLSFVSCPIEPDDDIQISGSIYQQYYGENMEQVYFKRITEKRKISNGKVMLLNPGRGIWNTEHDICNYI